MLPHDTKKPGCGPEIMEYFRKYPETKVTRPDQIAVVGDRLTTDVMMANMMGGYAVWVKDGVVPLEETSVVSSPLFALNGNHSDILKSLLVWSRSLLLSCNVEDMRHQSL